MPKLNRIGDLDLVLTSVAVLFEPTPEPTPINESDVAKVLRRPVTISQAPNGSLVISSNRDQIEIFISHNKLEARDNSGKTPDGETPLPEKLRYFLGLIGNPELKTRGINFIYEANGADTQRWLADNIIGSRVREITTGPISSKSASVTFQRVDEEWTLNFAAPTPERISVNFNSSIDLTTLPTDLELTEKISKSHGEIVEYLEALG